jgi:hypothetical protein
VPWTPPPVTWNGVDPIDPNYAGLWISWWNWVALVLAWGGIPPDPVIAALPPTAFGQPGGLGAQPLSPAQIGLAIQAGFWGILYPGVPFTPALVLPNVFPAVPFNPAAVLPNVFPTIPNEWDPATMSDWTPDGKILDWVTGNVPMADALGGGTGR